MSDVGKAEQGQGATETRRATANGSQGQRVTQTRSWGQRCALVARRWLGVRSPSVDAIEAGEDAPGIIERVVGGAL